MTRLKAPQRIMAELATADFSDKITKYDLKKRLGLSYARVHEAIDGRKKEGRPFPGLEKRGFVKHKRLGKATTGLPKKAYKCTLKGLVYALTENPTLWDNINLIAQKNWELLPYLFGKWGHFQKYGCETLAVDILKSVFCHHHALMEKLVQTGDAKTIGEFGDKLFADAVYGHVFRPEHYHVLSDADIKKWISAIKNDLDLSSKYTSETKAILDTAKYFKNLADTRSKNISDSPITKKEKEKVKGGEKA